MDVQPGNVVHSAPLIGPANAKNRCFDSVETGPRWSGFFVVLCRPLSTEIASSCLLERVSMASMARQ